MSSDADFSSMKLTSVLKEFMDSKGWEDEIKIDDDGDTSVASTFNINDQGHRFFFEIFEAGEVFKLYMYSPFSVPALRKAEMAIILNFVNMRVRIGRFATPTEDKSSPVQFFAVADVEGGQLGATMINTMINACTEYFEVYGPLMATVALTKISAKQAIADFIEEETKAAADAVPDEL
jgi:hypothetical protein